MDKETKDSPSTHLFFGSLNRSALSDAEARNKPALIPYRVTWGVSLRRHLERFAPAKVPLLIIVGIAYLFFWAILFGVAFTQIGYWFAPYLLGGSLLLFFAALILPTDKMYMDRLSFMLPDRNLFAPGNKVLWSRIEQLSIVDVAEKGERSRFALRLSEASGEPHDLLLSAMDKDALPTLTSYIQTYAPHVRGLVQLQELERFYDYESGKLEGVSYTQLWESGAALRFGLTSFTPLLPGAVLQETFKIEKQIAAGGFSAVYLASGDDDVRFVIKESVVPFNLDEELKSKAQEQFQREAKLLAKLNHPQIARVFDHFVENGRSYMRMQYVEGTNLRSMILDKQSVSEAVAIKWLEELASILAYLHELSPPVVHRDISPDNILITADDRLVLIDFGAANEFIGAATGTLVGKHAYMAPEQIRANAEPRSDLYSLGACGYFCVAGRDPEPIRRSSPKAHGYIVSDWFDQLIQRLTALDRDERFASARECLQHIRKPAVAPGVKAVAADSDRGMEGGND